MSTVGLLTGRRILVTGVATRASIALHTARAAQDEGADVVLTAHRRPGLARLLAAELPYPCPVYPLDVTDPESLAALPEALGPEPLHGVLHSIAHAPPSALGRSLLTAEWPDVATALQVSAYSFAALAAALRPLLGCGSAVVGVDFDGTRVWPGYGWMGVAKAALESCSRYLAHELGPDGIRVNLVGCGPLTTHAATGVSTFPGLAAELTARAPLGWDPADPAAVARTCVALLSPLLPATTGAIVPADGGAHCVGADVPEPSFGGPP